MRLKKCKKCGTVFEADSKGIYMCPACSAEIKRESVVRLRTCRECGSQFYGGPRAWYCPECREKVESETENVPFAKILNPPARKHRYLQKMW